MKKIISFSLWGDNPTYTKGAIENIKLQQVFYPGWICRFYVHNTVPSEIIEELKSQPCEIIIKDTPIGEGRNRFGMFWRFEVMKDPDVEMYIVRDADSRLSQREKNCVKDWIKSGKDFHIIRDHEFHSTRIMGGMWGGKNNIMKYVQYDTLLETFNNMTYTNTYASDQEFLARMIYPLIKSNMCVHDDYKFFPDENPLKIPHLRNNNEFIGQPIAPKI